MKQLPAGVYAVSESFTEGTVTFTFRQEEYTAQVGRNAFPNLETLVYEDLQEAREPFCGYCGVPVVVLPAGLLHIGSAGKTKEERFRTYFPKAPAILGENVGVNPNEADLRTAASRREESVIEGSYYFGALAMRGEVGGTMTVDGITLRTKIYDERTGGENVSLQVKNCVISSPLAYNLIFAGPDFVGARTVTVTDCRADGLNGMQGEGNLICVRSGDLQVQRLYMANTNKFLGMTNYARSVVNDVGHVVLKDSIFENCGSTGGFSVNLPQGARSLIEVDNCQFLNFTPAGEPAITAVLHRSAHLSVTNCTIAGSGRRAIEIDGVCAGVCLTGTTQTGYEKLCASKPRRRTAVDPETVYPIEDPHEVPEEPDFSRLDALYEGRQVYFGDFHCHSKSGGTSDGKYPIEDYVQEMKRLQMDFAAIVDHRQMRHYFLPCWDEQYLICGSEPGTTLNIPERPIEACKLHYAMIFPDKTGLAQVMGAFPEFEYTGKWDGQYKYPRFTLERFRELGEYIYSIGGLMSHAHPKQMMVSENPMDYYISDHVPLETVVGSASSFSTKQNRDLWEAILKLGKRVHTYGMSDAHSAVSNKGLTAVYAPRHYSTDIFNTIRSGDCAAGGVGIQMSIGDTPMGGVAADAVGQQLCIRVGKFHEDHWLPDTVYSLKVYTDQGLAYAREFDGSPISLALTVQDRAFYRAEIINESDNAIVAISNPIWLER